MLQEGSIGNVSRESQKRFIQAESLFRVPPLRRIFWVWSKSRLWILPRHGRVDSVEGIRWLDGEIAAKHRIDVDERPHAIGFAAGALSTESLFGVLHVGGCVRGLDGGDDAQFADAFLVVWVDDLGVFDAEAVVAGLAFGEESVVIVESSALLLEGCLEGVEGVAVGEVADGVDVDLEAFAGPGSGDLGEGGGVDEERAGCPWVVAVRVQHGTSPASEGSIFSRWEKRVSMMWCLACR